MRARQDRAAAVDPDDDELLGLAGTLHDLVGDAHERAADVVVVEDDLRVRHFMDSFLASRDRVKGRVRA